MKKIIFINFLLLSLGIFILEVFFGKWFTKEKYFCSYLLCENKYTFEQIYSDITTKGFTQRI